MIDVSLSITFPFLSTILRCTSFNFWNSSRVFFVISTGTYKRLSSSYRPSILYSSRNMPR